MLFRTYRFALTPFLGFCVLATACLTPPPKVAGKSAPQTAPAPAYSGPSEAYQWKSVVINGGGFVTGLIFSPVSKGILYARTDVGGAYRYESESKSWTPITDFLGPKESNYMGIESVAADPVNADRVYMAVGMYTASWASSGAFLRSDDRGTTWKTFPVPFKMGGNDLSRSDGERLAIDPNRPNILYFGSRRSGLFKSEDSAESWSRITEFPVRDDSEKGLGLPFVLFERASGKPGQPTPTLYVGSQVDGMIYRSRDAGKSWEALPKQPTVPGFLPRRAMLDKAGTLFITYAYGDSPYALSKGAVHKFDTRTETWTDITPLRPTEADTFGYGGISLDPSRPGTLIVATMDRWTKGAEVFRSQDGGKTWKPTMASANIDGGGIAHVYHHHDKLTAPQWVGDIQIDPFDSNRAMLVEGGGVWATWNLTATDEGKPAHWSFHSSNLEELCIRDLVSPPVGPALVSVMGDACGMRHDDPDVTPAGGTFQNPTCATSDDVDFAGKKPNVMVRVGTYPWDGSKGPRGALSLDGGTTWKPFATEPPGSGGLGSVVVSAEGDSIVWAPREASAAFSRDAGKTWSPSVGLPGPISSPDWTAWFLRLASDSVSPKKIYAFNTSTGEVFRSADGGASFKVTDEGLKNVPEYERHYVTFKAVPGREGDLWITTKTELYHSTDSGDSFDQVSGIDEAHGVGFGKAAPGKDYPAIYLSGKIDGQFGFFRSDDSGSNWVRVNDDLHQYGGATVITGDPRIYGRVYVAPGGRGIVYGEPKKK